MVADPSLGGIDMLSLTTGLIVLLTGGTSQIIPVAAFLATTFIL
jgi:hypothetical protein